MKPQNRWCHTHIILNCPSTSFLPSSRWALLILYVIRGISADNSFHTIRLYEGIYYSMCSPVRFHLEQAMYNTLHDDSKLHIFSRPVTSIASRHFTSHFRSHYVPEPAPSRARYSTICTLNDIIEQQQWNNDSNGVSYQDTYLARLSNCERSARRSKLFLKKRQRN